MLRSMFKTVVAAVVVALAGAGTADAAFVNGSLGFSTSGGLTFNGATLSTSTSITAGSTFISVTDANGDLSTIGVPPPANAVISSPTFTQGPINNTFTIGGFTFTFSSIVFTPGQTVNNLDFTGTGAVSGNGYDPTLFTFTGSAVNIPAGPGGNPPAAQNAQFVLNATGGPSNVVPEPASLTLAGLAVVGFGARAVRRNRKLAA